MYEMGNIPGLNSGAPTQFESSLLGILKQPSPPRYAIRGNEAIATSRAVGPSRAPHRASMLVTRAARAATCCFARGDIYARPKVPKRDFLADESVTTVLYMVISFLHAFVAAQSSTVQ